MKHQIVCLFAPPRTPQRGERLGAAHLGPSRREPQRAEVLAQHVQHAGVALDEHRALGAARERLDPQRPGAGEQVEHPRPWQLAEHREQRLAHALGRRAAWPGPAAPSAAGRRDCPAITRMP